MGKNKKKFVSKDNSTKFVLLHRSQQDAEYGNEGASEYVLYPMDGQRDQPKEVSSLSLNSSKDHVNSLGFSNDGYNYEQHLLTISEGAQFISKSGVIGKAVLPPEALASTEEERDRQLEAVTLSDAVMDADMKAALFDPQNFDSWDLNDDFVDTAAGIKESGEAGDDSEEEFDYDAHIAKMLAASEKIVTGSGQGYDHQSNSDEYHSDNDSEDAISINDNQKVVELEFEKALQEYDSDECGSLEDPEYDESLQGQLAIDNDDVSKLMDEFLTIHERDRKFHSQTKTDTLLTKNDQISKLLRQNHEEEACEVNGFDEDSGDEDYMPEYLKPRETSEFDCESIVSTYSNIENHPVRILEKSKKTKKKNSFEEEMPRRNVAKIITISAKTGLPMVQEKSLKTTPVEAVNKGQGRDKKETKEEKKLRKMLVKEERRINRDTKSKLKSAYKEDEKLQLKTANASNGVPMFKY